MRERDARAVHLAPPRAARELLDQFHDLRDAACAHGVPARFEPAACVHGQRAAEARCARDGRGACCAASEESEVLERRELEDRERVVHFRDVHVPRRAPRSLEGRARCGPRRGERRERERAATVRERERVRRVPDGGDARRAASRREHERGRAVREWRAIEHAERVRDERAPQHVLGRDGLAEVRALVQRAVRVRFHGNGRERFAREPRLGHVPPRRERGKRWHREAERALLGREHAREEARRFRRGEVRHLLDAEHEGRLHDPALHREVGGLDASSTTRRRGLDARGRRGREPERGREGRSEVRFARGRVHAHEEVLHREARLRERGFRGFARERVERARVAAEPRHRGARDEDLAHAAGTRTGRLGRFEPAPRANVVSDWFKSGRAHRAARLLPVLVLALAGALFAPLAGPALPPAPWSAPAAAPAAGPGEVLFSPSTCSAAGEGWRCEASFEEATPAAGGIALLARLQFPGRQEYRASAATTSALPPELNLLSESSVVRAASRESQAESSGRDAMQALAHVGRSPAGELAFEVRFADRVVPDVRSAVLRVDVAPAAASASGGDLSAAPARRAVAAAPFLVLEAGLLAITAQATGSPSLPLDSLGAQLLDAAGNVAAEATPAADGSFALAADALSGLGTWSVVLSRLGPSGDVPTTLGLDGRAEFAPLSESPAPGARGVATLSAAVADPKGDAPTAGDLTRAWFGSHAGEWLAVGATMIERPARGALEWELSVGARAFTVVATFDPSGSGFALVDPEGRALDVAGAEESAAEGFEVEAWIPAAAVGLAEGVAIEGFAAATREGDAVIDSTLAAPARAWDEPAPVALAPTPVPTIAGPTAPASRPQRESASFEEIAMRVGFYASAVIVGLACAIAFALGLRRVGN